MHRIESAGTLGTAPKKSPALVNAHVQHVADRLALEAYLQGLAVEPLAAAGLAADEQIGEEIHLDFSDALARACLAAASLHIEAEPIRL